MTAGRISSIGRAGPAAGAEAGSAAQHHEARPLLHRIDQQPVLLRSQKIRRQVGKDIDVVAPRRKFGVVDLTLVSLCRPTNHHTLDLDVGRPLDGPHQEPIVPGEIGALEKQDVQPAAQNRHERTDLVVRDDQLAFLLGDLERDLFLAGRLRSIVSGR